MNTIFISGRIISWFLLLQEIDINVIDKLGCENVVVDLLSRISNEKSDEPLDDSFLDEHLFVVLVMTPWFEDITNYLVAHNLPQHFSSTQKNDLFRKSAPYTWIKE